MVLRSNLIQVSLTVCVILLNSPLFAILRHLIIQIRFYDALGITRNKEVIPHCHTNVLGSHAYFTLRLMGYDSVRAYEGSGSEYGKREDAVIT
jgi:hypothetical protein